MSRSNFRDKAPVTHRGSNFTSRLEETIGSELDPEMVTPQTAGVEELPSYEEKFPLIDQFRQTNMHGRKGKRGEQSGRGKDQD